MATVSWIQTHIRKVTQAEMAARADSDDTSARLRRLDPRQRRALELFRGQGVAVSSEIANQLGVSTRTASTLCRQWVRDGFLVVHVYRMLGKLTSRIYVLSK